MKHSPGPWTLSDGKSPVWIMAGDYDRIATVFLCDVSTHKRDDVHLGNAKLLANALRMYEMLNENLIAWEGEEDSVREEHAELIASLDALLEEIAT